MNNSLMIVLKENDNWSKVDFHKVNKQSKLRRQHGKGGGVNILEMAEVWYCFGYDGSEVIFWAVLVVCKNYRSFQN